jgi:small subunit ribosomal protein S4e
MSHIKRLAVPRTWTLNRKKNKFSLKPKPGPHSMEFSLPLGIILRDFLKYAYSISEAKKILNNNQVLIDGKKRKDYRLPVGLFDVISFPNIKKNYRILLDKKGRLIIKDVNAKESGFKPCKVINKTILPKNKLQLNLSDGKNIITNKKCDVGDTVLLTLPDQKIQEIFKLKKDAFVFLIKGKYAGDSGLLQEIKNKQAIYQKDGQKVETLKKYLFVLGDKKPAIDITLIK